jgi:hypothetical protein
LGWHLFEAYRREANGDPAAAFYPDRKLSAEVRARWDEEGPAWCKRRIVEHCLYGVDLNPAAVQLAQVGLWIESLAGDRPLSFFAHHIRNGNSLLGSSLSNYDRPPHPKLGKASDRRTIGLFEAELKKRLEAAFEERKLIDAPLPPEVRADTPDEYAYKEDRLRRAEAATETARLLLNLRSTAAFLPAIWAAFPSLMSSTDLNTDARSQPWWKEFKHIRDRERFFHWELEFPEVFADGGFDCVLGNPPWEKIKPDRKEFYGRADVLIRAYAGGELDARILELQALHPELAAEFDRYFQRLKTLASCLKGGGDYKYVEWEINGESTGGDPDLFKFFVERAHYVLKCNGRLGMLVPSALYTNEGCTGLRHLLLDEMRIERFYGFENRQDKNRPKIFPIDSRYKFVCLVAEKCVTPEADAEFRAAFMRHDVEELESGPPAGIEVLVRRAEIAGLSPGTFALLEYRSERDHELVLKMHGLLPAQTPRSVLGEERPEGWNARFHREFHMTDDRELWTRSNGGLYTPKDICGVDWPADRSIPFTEVRARMAGSGFWPLYEGKHINQFLVDTKPIERWVSLEAAEKKYGAPPDRHQKLVFREVASNTNERTCIAAVLPERSCANHKLFIVELDALSLNIACTVLNSFPFDFLLRLRVSSTVSLFHASRVAVPSVADCRDLPVIETLSASDNQPLERNKRHFEAVWQANLAVAQAYGISSKDLAHVLSTFPVFACKHPELHRFLLVKLN